MNEDTPHSKAALDDIKYATLIAVISSLKMTMRAADLTLRAMVKKRIQQRAFIRRRRRTMLDLYVEYGSLFARAYRMSWDTFQKLFNLIKDGILAHIQSENGVQNPQPAPFYCNGPVELDVRMAVALRWFAGGSYLDIIISHGVSKSIVYDSIWAVVEAVNKCKELDLKFPSTPDECEAIASEFVQRSMAGFSNCVGCIDGLLIWIEKPRHTECEDKGVDSGKFYCGRKGKYGMNLQAVCDARRRFLDISIEHPASASDYLAFVTSALSQRLTCEATCLPQGYCLYGDSAYVNESFMAVPIGNACSGAKDDYNYFHSQVRINIECAFGILTNRWRVLKSPLNNRISINRVNALVACLCRLHNFCIDNGDSKPPNQYERDPLTLMDFSNHIDGEEARPLGLLDAGAHFDDIEGGRRGATVLGRRRARARLPREIMLQHVVELDIHRPRPFG